MLRTMFIQHTQASDGRYSLGKIHSILIRHGITEVIYPNQYGWANQPAVVAFKIEQRESSLLDRKALEPIEEDILKEFGFHPVIKEMDWDWGTTPLKYFASAVGYEVDGDPDSGIIRIHEPFTDEELQSIVMWTVYEYQEPDENGIRVSDAIADFYGGADADDAKAFAIMKNNQTR